MSEAKTFTPGPWWVDDEGVVRHDVFGGSTPIMVASGWVEGAWVGADGNDESRANARLIAASPALYNVLRRIVNNPNAQIGGDIRAEAVAALKSAEGASQ